MLVEILSNEELIEFLQFGEKVAEFHLKIPLQHILRVVSTKADVSVNNSSTFTSYAWLCLRKLKLLKPF